MRRSNVGATQHGEAASAAHSGSIQHAVTVLHGEALPPLLFPPFFLSFFLGMIVQMQQ